MMNQNIPWPPRVGDRVGVKGSALFGTVIGIEEAGDEQRYILKVQAPSATDPQLVSRWAVEVKNAADAYTLSDLEQRALD